MASMTYGVSGNGKRGFGYESPKHSRVKTKSKQKATKPKTMYSHFTYGHTHDYAAQKSQVKKNSRKTNKKGSKKIWISKDKIIYVANILSNKVKILVLVPIL